MAETKRAFIPPTKKRLLEFAEQVAGVIIPPCPIGNEAGILRALIHWARELTGVKPDSGLL
jgi:hypothetical protein